MKSRSHMMDEKTIARIATLSQAYSIAKEKKHSQGEIVRIAVNELFDRSGHVIEAAAKKLQAK